MSWAEPAPEDARDTRPRTPTSRHGRPRRPRTAGQLITGFIGELLLTAGLLIGLFVVWQVYYTDVIGQRQSESHLAEMSLPEPPEQVAAPQEDLPPQPDGDGSVREGDLGVLYVPTWGEQYREPIAEGASEAVIDNGYVGHYPETQMPGEVGNFALAGHRQSRGKPFRHVDSLNEGDPIIVRTEDAFYVYRVTDHRIVLPSQVEVLDANPHSPGEDPEEAMLTLTTCHPLWSTRERWIVHAELDYWTDASEGRPADLPEGSL